MLEALYCDPPSAMERSEQIPSRDPDIIQENLTELID
jgi:hypothetical protein